MKKLLLQFIASLTLCDHMGDVMNDIQEVLNRISLTEEWNDFSELREILASRDITTLYGTELFR